MNIYSRECCLHFTYDRKANYTSFDSVHYDRGSKHDIKHYEEFCLFKLLFLVFPLLVLDTHNLERKFREIRMKIGVEQVPRISQLRKFVKLTTEFQFTND